MLTYTLCFELLSAATFGRGDGVAGLVDREVEHDRYGLPYVRGKTVRGLLAEECANILYALRSHSSGDALRAEAEALFGTPGSSLDVQGSLRVGDARPPAALVTAVSDEVTAQRLDPEAVLRACTAIRRQTSFNVHGAPEHGSLRSLRVVLPGMLFESEVVLPDEPSAKQKALLAGCILAWRRGGTGRNRGRGRLRAWLRDESGSDMTAQWFGMLQSEVAQ